MSTTRSKVHGIISIVLGSMGLTAVLILMLSGHLHEILVRASSTI